MPKFQKRNALFQAVVAISSLAVINATDLITQIAAQSTAAKTVANLSDPMPNFATAATFGASKNSRSHVITLLASANYEGPFAVGPISTKGMELALDRLRAHENWLAGYEIAFELIDDECQDAPTLNHLMNKVERSDPSSLNRLSLMLITSCASQETSAELLNHYNLTGLSMFLNTPEFLIQRHRYRSFFGLGETGDKPYIALADFVIEMGWKQIAVISEIRPYFNNIERYFFPHLVRMNITLGWVGKIYMATSNEDEMVAAMEELVSHDQRVIFSNANSAIAIACWLHRYHLYGPSYALFFVNWVYEAPRGVTIPAYIASWCTRTMIADVFEGAFFLGDTSLLDVSDAHILRDSSGMTAEEFVANMKTKIDHPENQPGWTYWRTMYYDAALYIGMVLNRTETILNSRNETLLDWTISSEQFQNRAPEIAKVYQEAIYSTRVEGFRGIYEFEASTKANTKGYTPATLFQVQNAGAESPDIATVALYQASRRPKPLAIRYDLLRWRTKNGLPPPDRPLVVLAEKPLLSIDMVSVLFTFGSLLATSNGVVLLIASFRKGSIRNIRLNHFEMFILSGNFMASIHVFVLPSSKEMTPRIGSFCTAIFALIAIGYTLSIGGIFSRFLWSYLELKNCPTLHIKSPISAFKFALPTRTRKVNISYRSSVSVSVATERRNKKLNLLNAAWLLINVVLIATFFSVDPVYTKAVNGTLFFSKDDASLAYQSFVFKPHNNVSIAGTCIAAVFGCLHLAAILFAVLVGFKVRSLSYSSNINLDIDSTFNAFCCVILLFIGAFFLLLSLGSDYAMAVVSWMALIYVTTTFSIIFARKLFANRSEPTIRSVTIKPASIVVAQRF